MPTWSNGISLRGSVGAQGPAGASILVANAPPGTTFGNVGDYAIVFAGTGGSTVTTLYGAKTATGWPQQPGHAGDGAYPQGYVLTGAKGDAGAVGPAGRSILNGTSAPTAALGSDGDFYLVTGATPIVLFGPKASGAWPGTGVSLQGNQGVAGPAGKSLLNGSSVPTAGQGNDGDFYLVTGASPTLYGPKASGTWPGTGTALVGPQGAQGPIGTSILQTNGVPQSATGNTGDIAIDAQQGFIYGPKGASSWPTTPLVSTVGPTGAKGDTGAAAVLPNDYTGNSFIVAPVAGDANAVQLLIRNSGGTVLWKADASGNTTVGGTLAVSGASTLAAVNATNVSASGTLSVTGATTAAAVTSSATVTAKNLTLASGGGGSLTFADGTTQATASAASATGSRFILDAGGFFANSTAAGALYTLEYVQANDAALTGTPTVIHAIWKFPFPCTLTGWSINQYFNTGTQSFQVTKNRTSSASNTIYTNSNAGTVGSGGFPGVQLAGTITKGTYNFAAGDWVNVIYSHGTGTSTGVRMFLVFEWT